MSEEHEPTMEEIDADLDFMQERIEDKCPSCQCLKASDPRNHYYLCIRRQSEFKIRGTMRRDSDYLTITYGDSTQNFLCGDKDYEYLLGQGERRGNKFVANLLWT
jgi:hypothetical protein